MSYRAVIFDLDGTLLDTLGDIADAANGVLSSMGFPTHPRDAYKTFVGEGMVSLAKQALPEGARDDATVASWIPRVKEAFRKSWPAKTRPYDGIPELLDSLAVRGIKIAIFSNRPDDLTKLMAGTMLARWEFSSVHGACDGNPFKPDPSVALKIVKELGFEPSDCIFLGDSNVDMQASTAAGMFPVGALWGFRTGDELVAHGAKKLVAHPGELLGLL
ncbi:MAG TPA: HAD family hydrolase [bacterium]|nr:HAD family hydrolase [bacterium]